MKNKKIISMILIGFLLIGIIITEVLGADVCPTCGREFSSGIYKNEAGKIYKIQGECQSQNKDDPCTKATAQELLNKGEETLELQDSMDKNQAKEFNELKLKKMGINNFEGNTQDLYWNENFESFRYRNAKIDTKELARIGKNNVFFGDKFITASPDGTSLYRWDQNSFKLINSASLPTSSSPASACLTCPYSTPSGSQSQNPFSTPTFQQGGGFGSGISGGATGTGSPTPQLDQSLQIAMQMAGQAAQFLAALKPKDQIPPRENPPGTSSGPGFAETYLSSQSAGKVDLEKNKITLDKGAIVSIQDKNQELIRAGQTSLSSSATIKKAGENKIETNNLAFIRPNEIAAETTDTTNINFNGIPGNDLSNPPKKTIDSLASLSPSSSLVENIKRLFPLSTLITGKAIESTGQSIELIDHDLNVDGHEMNLYALKTFNKVEFGGNNLNFYDGDIQIGFENQRILYPRIVKNAPYGIKELKNKLDPNNEYKLQHYTNSMGKLYDNKDIIYVTDITTNPEKGPYSKLIINKDRMEMFS